MKNSLLHLLCTCVYLCFLFFVSPNANAHDLTIASKRFTESYVLAELVASQLEDHAQVVVVRKQGMAVPGMREKIVLTSWKTKV